MPKQVKPGISPLWNQYVDNAYKLSKTVLLTWAEVPAEISNEELKDIPPLRGKPSPSRGIIVDLSNMAYNTALRAEPQIAINFKKIREEAVAGIEDEAELVSRYADYQNAFLGTTTATDMIADLADKVGKEFDNQNKSWLDSIRSFLQIIKDKVKSFFERIFRGLESVYHGFDEFANNVNEFMTELGTKVKDKIVAALHKMIQSLSAIASRVISCFFGWVASVKKIATEKGFKLDEVSIKINPIEFSKISFFGFSIPIPKISTPEVNMIFK